MLRWLFAALVLVIAMPSAAAESDPTVRVFAHDRGHGDAWFEVAGHEGRNPELRFEPGLDVRIVFVNQGTVDHNLHFGAPLSTLTRLIPPGESAELNFTVPEDARGSFAYWCDPHRQGGMEGVARIVPYSTPTPTDATPQEPGSRASPTPHALAVAALVAGAFLGRHVRGRHR